MTEYGRRAARPRGVPANLVILSREGLSELIAARRIATGTDVDLARVPLGVAVRAGTPKSDVSTVDAFQTSPAKVRNRRGSRQH
jgi:molybdate transport system substrate-binding protein